MGLLVGRGEARLTGWVWWLGLIGFLPRRHMVFWAGRERTTPDQHRVWRGGWVFGPFLVIPLVGGGRSRTWSKRIGRFGCIVCWA